MKKMLLLLLTAVILCSCKGNDVLLVGEYYDSEWAENYQAVYLTEQIQDEKMTGETKSVDILGQKYSTTYCHSFRHNLANGAITHQFTYESTYNGHPSGVHILYSAEGTLQSIRGEYFLNISEDAMSSTEAIKAELMDKTSEIIDFGLFEHSRNFDTPYGVLFVWYNTIGDIPTYNNIEIGVSRDGYVHFIYINSNIPNDFEGIDKDISISDFEEKINSEITAILEKMNRKDTEYELYYYLCEYENKYYIHCSPVAKEPLVCSILVPID